jgi:hypothetical protein
LDSFKFFIYATPPPPPPPAASKARDARVERLLFSWLFSY